MSRDIDRDEALVEYRAQHEKARELLHRDPTHLDTHHWVHDHPALEWAIGELALETGAATRIPLSGLGVLQYIAPTLQFLCGVLIFHEPMPAVRMVGFVIVWLALAIFTWDALSRRRRALKDAALTEPAPAEEIR